MLSYAMTTLQGYSNMQYCISDGMFSTVYTCHSWTFLLLRLQKPSLAEAALSHLLQLCLHHSRLYGSGVDLRWNIHMHSYSLFLILFTTCHNTSHLNNFPLAGPCSCPFLTFASCSSITVCCSIYMHLCWYYYNVAYTYEVGWTAGVHFQFLMIRSLLTRLLHTSSFWQTFCSL